MKCFNLPITLTISLAIFTSNVVGLSPEHMIGGLLAEKNQFPYQIALKSTKYHVCGGTLIAPDIVLTAAHCVYNSTDGTIRDLPLTAMAGTINRNASEYSIAVKKIYAHSYYDYEGTSKYVNDIAVLRLADKFDVSGRLPIGTVSLPKRKANFLNKMAIVSGFGWDKVVISVNSITRAFMERGSSKGLLKYGSVKIVDSYLCTSEVNVHVLCGRMQQKNFDEGVCSGDSGGPLVYNNTIIGIVSVSPLGCAESRKPATYTKVSDFLDFIQMAINNEVTNEMLIKELI